jgi:hypothetical protein
MEIGVWNAGGMIMNEKFDKNKYHWCGVLNEAFIRLTVEKAV